MSNKRVNTWKARQHQSGSIYTDKQIEQYLFLLIYSGRHSDAESLFAELRKMLPGVDPTQMNRVAHQFASELKNAGLY
ncbi:MULTISPECIES: hypothetical protein [Modicisalibacter]|uniref:Transposase n=1 Tax=Modicisalibacter tunisiensis TaxID=390637 RepID=A0ABS7X0Z0_9GAMM|nr:MULTISPECIES: hypothetical protein [Modicisalibacter]KXS37077.1 MAG: Uncharacterized protein AWU55_2640 [Halomonadaceae bacterium T82-2]MBZ9538005.1 hypothetical protein [Modicisalibacter tunisiensis]MBZ9568578.1 hypothetical protein [Modicisalibacter tunisiensis]